MRKGQKATNKTKIKMSEALKGRKFSKETRKKISEAKKGSIHSEETRKKMSEAQKGRKATEETLKKLRKAKSGINHPMFGKHHSEEHKKKISEALSGEKAYQWLGGKSFEAYGLEFNEDLREVIRNRDRRECKLCEKTELENTEKLSIHHIDYNKKNNNPNNLITLCRNCHTKTNHKREYWRNHFTVV